MCRKPGGRRLRFKYGPQLVSGKLLEPVASFWRQQRPKSAMFLATLFCLANNIEHFLQLLYSSVHLLAKWRLLKNLGHNFRRVALLYYYSYSLMSWTNDGFCRYAHARVITDFKNMADYHEERTLKASGKGENEDKNDCHNTTRHF